MILYHSIRLEYVGTNLISPGNVFFLCGKFRIFLLFLLAVIFVKFCAEHAHTCLTIKNLASLALTGNNDSCRNMRKADGRICLIDVLTAFSAGAVCINAQILRTYVDFDRIVKHRENEYTSKRSVTARIRIKRTYAHKPVNASLALKMTVDIIAVNLHCNRFYSAFRFQKVNDFNFVTVPFRPASVHTA